MPQVDRFSVSLDTELLAAFDHHIAHKGYENRSEAIRDLIRELLVSGRIHQGNETIVAVLTAVVDHRDGDIAQRLRATLTAHADLVRGSLQITIDEDRDEYAIALGGPADGVHALANEIQAMRGISHGHLSSVPSRP